MAELFSAIQSMVLALRERLADVIKLIFPALQMPEDLVRELDEGAGNYRENHEARIRGLLKSAEGGKVAVAAILEAMFELDETLPNQVGVRLFSYLSKKDRIDEMVRLMMSQSYVMRTETDMRKRYPYTFVVSSLLISGTSELRFTAVKSDYLWSSILEHFQRPPPLQPQMTSVVARIVVALGNDYTVEVLRKVEGKGLLAAASKHLAHPAVADMFSQLFRTSPQMDFLDPSARMVILEYFAKEDVFEVLLNAFVSACERERVCKPLSVEYMQCVQEEESAVIAIKYLVARITPLLHELAPWMKGNKTQELEPLNFLRNEHHMDRLLNAAICCAAIDEHSPALAAAMKLAVDLLHLTSRGFPNDASREDDDHFAPSGSGMFLDEDIMEEKEDDSLLTSAQEMLGAGSGSDQEERVYERVVLAKLPELRAILERHIARGRVEEAEADGKVTRLGMTILDVVTFLTSCFQAELPNLRKMLYELHIESQLFEMMDLHRDNSMLHRMVELVIELGLLGPSPLGRIHLLKDFHLVDRLLDIWDAEKLEWAKPDSQTSTFLSACVQLLYCTWEAKKRLEENRATSGEDFEQLLGEESSKRFQKFCDEDLVAILQVETLYLGGVHPPRRPQENTFMNIRSSLGAGSGRFLPVENNVDSDEEAVTPEFIRRRSSSRLRKGMKWDLLRA